jgi:RNA polymerase sigma-70 factor, ECF subfamily
MATSLSARDRRLNELVHQHIRFVERVLRNLGVTEEELDDAVQRTFIVIANRLDDITLGAEKSFLFKAAKHMASHVRRSRLRTRGHEPISDELPSGQDNPEQLISQKKARELLDDILGKMPGDLRAVFTLYEFEQLRMPEIAELLDIPLGTVASRLRRAREAFSMRVKRLEAASEHQARWKIGS